MFESTANMANSEHFLSDFNKDNREVIKLITVWFFIMPFFTFYAFFTWKHAGIRTTATSE